MAKKTFTLAPQEELGARIDQNIAAAEQAPTLTTTPLITPPPTQEKPLLPSQQMGREERIMVKQLWLDEEIYNKCVQAQANRKKKKLPSSFDAFAYDAIVAYLNNPENKEENEAYKQ